MGLVCFNSFISNPPLGARRAMAAALPLPPRGIEAGFSKLTFSYADQLAQS